jgi:hypothetical protein
MLQRIGSSSGIAAHEGKCIVTVGCDNQVILRERATGRSINSSLHDHLVNSWSFGCEGKRVRARLRATMAPLLIAGAMATALVVASSTTSAPVSENLCTSGSVHTMGTNGSTVTAALAPARPVAVQIPVNACSHPCDALYQSRTEACGELSGSKDSLCMSEAADRHGHCLSVFK